MRRRFQPSAGWILEDRIALSTATAAADVTAAPMIPAPIHATFHGHVTTTTHGGIDTMNQDASLTGGARIPILGAFKLAGDITNNFVDIISYPDKGTITLTSKTGPGSLTLTLTGPHSDLAPTTPTSVHLTFSVTKATGQFSPYAGHTGTADLTMTTTGPQGIHLTRVNHGSFTLALSVN